ncbi:uncharacterized protein LOC126901920 [Daktulosphaira vitifoliae]|uniref:uncharacterized protein LOC126901920 n=1 Tax=Daktulosphaira vitifoliae TaxID=58002 RepID=UPI0021AA38E8|nr:uncharacterized protein LOC126901920 [Daktulosphaira vitifoliae]
MASSIVINVALCRICLTENEKLVDVLETVNTDRNLIKDIYSYYNVQINGDDGKSKMVCKNCIRNIDLWREHVKKAADAQFIIDYIAKKAHDSSQNINEKQFSSSFGKNNVSSRRFQTTCSFERKIMTQDYKKLIFSKNHKPLANSCPLCINFNDKHLQYNTHELCSKHTNAFTCLVPNCYYIFATLELFIKHYRRHINLKTNTYLCRQCFKVLESPRKSKLGHSHQDISIFLVCCSTKFLTMSDFVLHKIQKHSGKIIHSNAQYKQFALDFITPINTFSKLNTDFECVNCELFTCLVPNCNNVYNVKSTNYRHYVQHANISEKFSTCSICLYSCLEINYVKHGIHKSPSIKCSICNVEFESIHNLAEHRLFKHNSVILCSPNLFPGCPVCNIEFENDIDTYKHYLVCLTKKNEDIIKLSDVKINSSVNSFVSRKAKTKEDISSYVCKMCGLSCFSVLEYVEHAKKEHKMYIMLKENGIKLCPLCDQNFLSNDFVAHIEQCTNSMKIEDMLKNCFKCVYCNFIFEDLAPSQFRAHLLYCKSFEEKVENGINYYCCLNCTFRTREHSATLGHATSFCIYFQLKMKYAMGPDEKLKVEERENLLKEAKIIVECKEDFPSINGKLSCKNCPQKFLSYKEAVEHWKRCSMAASLSTIQKSKSKPCFFFCTQCKSRFFNQTLYQNHILRHKGTSQDQILRSWQCGTCWTSFDSEVELNNHSTIHELQAGVPTAVPINAETDTLIKMEDIQDCDMESKCLEQDVILDEVFINGNQINSISKINHIILDNFNDQNNVTMDDDNLIDDIEDKPDLGHILMENMHGI